MVYARLKYIYGNTKNLSLFILFFIAFSAVANGNINTTKKLDSFEENKKNFSKNYLVEKGTFIPVFFEDAQAKYFSSNLNQNTTIPSWNKTFQIILQSTYSKIKSRITIPLRDYNPIEFNIAKWPLKNFMLTPKGQSI